MSTDLTCPQCDGNGRRRLSNNPCSSCGGTGRRRPLLVEWDALKAELIDTEADAQAWCNEAARYRRALTRIYTTVRSRSARKIARAVLNREVL